ncbi:MAG: ABC transporter substrate-binding protein [Polynucleobacter sp.]
MKYTTLPLSSFKICLGVVLCGFLALTQAATEVIDDRGKSIVFNAPPQRLISLLPSLTESICALGKCSNLVGIDRFSNWPLSLQTLPKLGGISDSNLEGIVQLKPDLVLVDRSSPIIARLEGLHIPVMAFDIKTMADEERALKKMGLALGSNESDRVWKQIQAEITRANKQLDGSQKNMRVYFEVNSAPYAAGRTSFIGELLTRLELNNIIPESLGAFPKINPEFVVQAKPEIIMLSETRLADMKKRPGWSAIPAIAQDRICVFNKEQSDILVRPGPRMGQAAAILSQCISEKVSSSK